MVGAGLVYEIIAAACSSPQTTEINADTRAETLMKWVHIGLVQSAVFIGVAAAVDRKHAPAIVTGGLLAAGFMYASYFHARAAGMGSNAPGTEGQDSMPWTLPKAS
jgi:hypothetical protein